ncbi:MAG: DnaJ C-terminal domain-containing protein, partial [Spirochaetaceae bacterium]|nr:DnaJ C-terminal domain-containing protein [Spirochaetaceae bacterium]
SGTDLHMDIGLGIYTAVLGGALAVRTIAGTFELAIPPETRNGTVFKLKGRGFPVYREPGSHGDLFLRMLLELPEKLTLKEKALFADLAALRKGKASGVPA